MSVIYIYTYIHKHKQVFPPPWSEARVGVSSGPFHVSALNSANILQGAHSPEFCARLRTLACSRGVATRFLRDQERAVRDMYVQHASRWPQGPFWSPLGRLFGRLGDPKRRPKRPNSSN
eukprot:2199973-Pyramimonas_sp.AAC.1